MELCDLKGIGKQRKAALEDAGIFTVEDLINYFPYKYYDFSKTEPFSDDGRVKIIKATVKSDAKVIKTKQKLSFVTAKMTDEFGCEFNAVWFNQTYVKNLLHTQNVLFLYGKNSSTKKNTFVVSFFKNYDETKNLGAMPVYHTISGLGQKVLRDAINESLKNTEFSEIVPKSLLLKYNLMDLKTAYILVHNPENLNEIERAIYRIQIEKLIPLIAINEYNKHFNKVIKKQQYLNTINLENEFKNLLPYNLTEDQNKAIYDIEKNMSSKYAMNRLLQGDVGSGKTVVALFGAYISAKNNYQSAIIAPTEILAEQHYETITKLFEKTGIKTALLTSSVSGAKKSIILEQIKNNEIQIVVGTHSILSDQIKFQNLSYAVIDEQHRFGVKERAKLTQKGVTPDILIMSATPIPRSLSLVLYGDLELTTINSRPKPLNTITNLVSEKKQDDMWNYIREKVNSGEKVYVVCSKIDEENEDDSVIKFSAKSMYNFLLTKFKREDVALIHGKLKRDEQNKIIEKFRRDEIKVLVSTTIVEVGMDIPNARYMVIATPERFGLATLHQLRGRIGRDGNEAHCFLLTNNITEKSAERIMFFKNNQNGFQIAEFDLKSRGAGSVFGTNQHGNDNGLLQMFSSEAFSTSKQILEHIKVDPKSHEKVLELGSKLYGKLMNNIVLN